MHVVKKIARFDKDSDFFGKAAELGWVT
jgi:hypothetical protein